MFGLQHLQPVALDVRISNSSNPTTLTTADWTFYRYNLDDASTGF